MFKYRLLSALAGIPVAVVIVCLGDVWLATAAAMLAVAGFHEFCRGVSLQGIRPVRPLGYTAIVALLALSYGATRPTDTTGATSALEPLFGPLILVVLAAVLFGALGVEVIRYHSGKRPSVVVDVGATMLGVLYVGLPFSLLVLLRNTHAAASPVAIPGFAFVSLSWGARLLLLVFCTTWATDVGAYFVGKTLGRHPLSAVSPNKTWEGWVGGVVPALAVGLGFGAWFQLPGAVSVPVGLAAGLLGPGGDLCKSVVKRDLGLKDFGALIPGHGGVLDRFDSLFVVLPAVYLWVTFVA